MKIVQMLVKTLTLNPSATEENNFPSHNPTRRTCFYPQSYLLRYLTLVGYHVNAYVIPFYNLKLSSP